ncbi:MULTISPECIES: TetR/AcrR family transcriptional regulator [unclassified Clostridium]|jgi:AcrR family transcriptional regulator|uniref:TetR/AcrR family transcriptional regulator n=1 Tax=unclassified Clostridium TaxID=2614128 RepID=UPI003F8DAC29
MKTKENHTQKTNSIEQWMIDALISLMTEKPFHQIKVKEIVDRAQLARCTFYRYYNSKEELLIRYCQSIIHELSEKMITANCKTLAESAYTYFSFWETQKNFLNLLIKGDVLYFFLQRYDELMFEMAKEVKPKNATKGCNDFSPKIRYHFFFAMQGLWGMTNRWILHGYKETPEELVQYLIAYIVETYELEPDCQYYDVHNQYPYETCYVKPGYE